MPWYVYVIECRGALLYTGITSNLERRIKEHKSGNGCKFTRYRVPVRLRYSEKAASRSAALKREAAIKLLPRKKKLELIRKR